MLEIEKIIVSPLMQNCRILHCRITNKSVLVDPGGDAERIIKHVEKSSSQLDSVWLTHSHLDHCGAVDKVLNKYNVRLYASKLETVMRSNVESVSELYGIPKGVFENCREPDIFIDDLESLNVGQYEFKVIFTPGHSPGHYSFYNKENSVLIAGDTLFNGSIGRSDLPGGDHELLMKSIKEKLLTLPAETKVLSGHGDDTEIAIEKSSNPFLNGSY